MTIPQQAAVGIPSPQAETGELLTGLTEFRLAPATFPSDPNWDNSPCRGEVTVRALSPADARVVAADAEIDFTDIDAKPGDGNRTAPASAFRNEKLYRVQKLAPVEGAARRGVIRRGKRET